MDLLSVFQRKNGPGARSAVPQDAVAIAAERARARRRLVGAVVLVLAGVIGFPLLFDTAPRPLPVDMPIEIPGRDAAPPLAGASAPRTVARVEGGASDAQAEVASGPVPPSVGASPAAVTQKPSEPPAAVAAQKTEAPAEPPPAVRQADAARAQAVLEGRPDPAKPPASAAKPSDAAGRFVVQVGAFSEAESAREARARVEKLGIKTYTQVVETAAGKRIRVRVGPYDDRAEAEKVAARMKQAGIASAVRAP